MFVQGNAVPQVRAATLVSFDSLVHQRNKRGLEIFGRFIQANNVLFVRLHGFCQFRLERFKSHGSNNSDLESKVKSKICWNKGGQRELPAGSKNPNINIQDPEKLETASFN